MVPRLVLASASPARRRLLEDAGVIAELLPTGVPEDGVDGSTAEKVDVLAHRKAQFAVHELRAKERAAGRLVLGCDSLLDVDGISYGKPESAPDARARWELMRGRAATLMTGHCLVECDTDLVVRRVAATTVRFADPTDHEIDAYIETGEPLAVAGAFTLDGRAAPFVDAIDGDPGTVIGLSLPLLRVMLREVGVEIVDLWS